MTERPILFSAPMVRAILAGQKSQTRRVVKPQPSNARTVDDPHGWRWKWSHGIEWGTDTRSYRQMFDHCPYGVAGDRLWVRETWGEMVWRTIIGNPAPPRTEIVYRAGPHPFDRDVPHGWNAANRWKPSIHMPRTHSRLTLEITGVRVERLQAIGEKDALAEGCRASDAAIVYRAPQGGGTFAQSKRAPELEGSAVGAYAILWDSINAKRGLGWDVNPWVWVIEFAKIAPTPRGSRE